MSLFRPALVAGSSAGGVGDSMWKKVSDMSPEAWIDIGFKAIAAGCTLTVSYHVVKCAYRMIAGADQANVDIQTLKRTLAKRLRRPEIEVMDLNSHEARLSVNCVSPDEISVTFADIGGMTEQLEMVRDNIILPMQMSRLHDLKGMLACPTGALLFGRPGTGKTMTAQALAKEVNATFISIKASTIMEKYLGESDKMAAAIFSLARKLSPTIIFIDEIDTLLRNREQSDNSGIYSSMQGVLLAEWDGLAAMDKPVVVLGATNRPQDLDKAFLRRMPVMIKVEAPDLRGRLDILQRMLANDKMDSDVSLEEVALDCEHFTGSDLREMVRIAKLQRAKQIVASRGAGAAEGGIRPLQMSDFVEALSKARSTGVHANDYASQLLFERLQETSYIQNKALEMARGAESKTSDQV